MKAKQIIEGVAKFRQLVERVQYCHGGSVIIRAANGRDLEAMEAIEDFAGVNDVIVAVDIEYWEDNGSDQEEAEADDLLRAADKLFGQLEPDGDGWGDGYSIACWARRVTLTQEVA